MLLGISRQLFCTAAAETKNTVPAECTTNKTQVTIPELSKASCYYKLIESFYDPSVYCSIRYMLLPDQYAASRLNIIRALSKVLLHGIQLLNYILQLLTAYLVSNPCAVITLFKWAIFTSTFDFLTQSRLNILHSEHELAAVRADCIGAGALRVSELLHHRTRKLQHPHYPLLDVVKALQGAALALRNHRHRRRRGEAAAAVERKGDRWCRGWEGA